MAGRKMKIKIFTYFCLGIVFAFCHLNFAFAQTQMTLNEYVQKTRDLIDEEKQYAQFVEETLKNASPGSITNPLALPNAEKITMKSIGLGMMAINFNSEKDTDQFKEAQANLDEALRIQNQWISEASSVQKEQTAVPIEEQAGRVDDSVYSIAQTVNFDLKKYHDEYNDYPADINNIINKPLYKLADGLEYCNFEYNRIDADHFELTAQANQEARQKWHYKWNIYSVNQDGHFRFSN
jgi:hypothetical protein